MYIERGIMQITEYKSRLGSEHKFRYGSYTRWYKLLAQRKSLEQDSIKTVRHTEYGLVKDLKRIMSERLDVLMSTVAKSEI